MIRNSYDADSESPQSKTPGGKSFSTRRGRGSCSSPGQQQSTDAMNRNCSSILTCCVGSRQSMAGMLLCLPLFLSGQPLNHLPRDEVVGQVAAGSALPQQRCLLLQHQESHIRGMSPRVALTQLRLRQVQQVWQRWKLGSCRPFLQEHREARAHLQSLFLCL